MANPFDSGFEEPSQKHEKGEESTTGTVDEMLDNHSGTEAEEVEGHGSFDYSGNGTVVASYGHGHTLGASPDYGLE